MVFRPIVQVKQQRFDERETFSDAQPKRSQAIHDKIGSDFGRGKEQIGLVVLRQENATGGQDFLRLKIVVSGAQMDAGFAVPRKRTDVDGCLRIQTQAQDRVILPCLGMGLGQLLEDSVGLLNFFGAHSFSRSVGCSPGRSVSLEWFPGWAIPRRYSLFS